MAPAHRPLVIGHRGAPGYLPEHSLDSYRLALRLGVDALETDVVMTRDGALVLRHENELSRTTDVASRAEFAGRRTTKVIGGKRWTGWFTEDFTLAELAGLGAPTTDHPIITLDTLLLLVAEESRRRGRRVGLHVEVKHPTHFASIGLPVTDVLLKTLADHGVDGWSALPGLPTQRLWLQSFDAAWVREMSSRTDLPLVQLVDKRWGAVDCAEIATYAQAIGPKKSMVRKKGQPPTGLADEAHRHGLQVFVWTLKAGRDQANRLFEAGVDGVFADYPDRPIAALAEITRTYAA
ncbi:glycerophosphoryl diester phosphodiesterase [Nocardioides luteus]|uniref:glycerophosphodiester phosphodiesterase n=1 Tax=Nocardioides luteus TaxID=1844 RepID=A0ABQ5T4D6_9ACTN|nr:glycerophosphodiester phosphodiesterase family protein [Nocardioides luteus]MDR7309006.1 glycerophosphoryl diester phosphodiesterase [Nocardioides luteus]GGR71222.1 glycerophosphoryl diester phosphodiesterase [Nocardioides luteus]GLJ70688.1 glycerophosphoryl diester phosphodiesterase [Nocardioides luteus]